MMKNDDVLLQRKNLAQRATEQQRLASDPQKSIWVGASAGTGKTKVLSDRVLRILLNGTSPNKILCLTYTKAAAVEMSSRVAKKLAQWATMNDSKLEAELSTLYGHLPSDAKKLSSLKEKARQLFAVLLDTPGGIKIQTIHSFCQEILKRFPLEANVSPYFEVLDDRGSLEAITEIKNKILTAAQTFPDSEIGKAISYMTSNVSEYSFPKIIDNIITNRSKTEKSINYFNGKQNLLNAVSKKLEISDDLTIEKIMTDFFAQMPKEDLYELVKAGYKDLNSWLDQDRNISKYEQYFSIFLTLKNEIRSTSKNKILKQNEKLIKIFNSEAERCLAIKQKIKSYNVYQSTKAVIILATELIENYNKFKQNHAKLDYNDMILITKNLLEKRDAAKWVLYKLDGGIDHILIDEAQDTSPDQWAIIQSISDEFFSGLGASEKNRTIFAVGDRKQSIYSFQGADPDKFDEMREHFAKLSQNFAKVNLDVSFRSTDAVLDTVNQIFADENVKKGVASVNEKIEHIAFRKGEAGCVEFWECLEPEETKTDDTWQLPIKHMQKISTSSQMAQMIAHKIKQLVTTKQPLISKNRPLQYGDFLVLVRSRDSFCEELIRECKNLNINISGIDRIKLMEQIAVQDLVSLGKFLLLPEDDLSLAEVLKSPLFGLDDNDLFDLCYQRKGTLWASVLKNEKYTQTSNILKELLNLSDYLRPFELYNYILSKNGGRKKYFERMGPEAEDGIDEFLNLSLIFEQDHIASLQNFINWICEDDVEIKREMEQSKNDMVRLMTVHGSKGLQAPIVILPDTTRVPSGNRGSEFLWDDNLFLYPNRATDFDETCDQIKNRQNNKMLEEYRRLLYVAATRAEDIMIFCGFRKKNNIPENSWYNIFKNIFTKFAHNNQNVWIYQNEQQLSLESKTPVSTFKTEDKIPDFMFLPAAEEKPLSKPLTPSKPEDNPAVTSPLHIVDDTILYKRGTIIHKLLQFIPDIDKEKQSSSIIKYIKNIAPDFSEKESLKICHEVMSLIDNPEFGIVFSPNSQAEVPIMGEINGKIISGQIDRLIITDQKVIVVDYKTNRNTPKTIADVPDVYFSQLAAYKALLQKIYPQKEIETYILWTNTAFMMKI